MESKGLTPAPATEEQFDSAAAAVETTASSAPAPAEEEVKSEAAPAEEAPAAPEVKEPIEPVLPESSPEDDPDGAMIESIEAEEAVGASEQEVPAEVAQQEPESAEDLPASAGEPAEVSEEITAQESEPTRESQEEVSSDPNINNPYAGKSQSELTAILEDMIANRPVQNLRGDIEAVKIGFYKAGRAEIETQRNAFIAGGGDPEEFKPAENPLEGRFKELLLKYREKRDSYLENAEQEKEHAYQAKLQIIEELKELVNGHETLGNTFQIFRELQQRWKDAGIVPQEKIKDLWDTYHHHVENFYNYIKINRELRDLDLKKNHEAKTALAEEAESLMLDPSATSAFHKLQKLHEEWREIGPVAPEFKEALWNRFKAASTQINKRHQEYFEGIKEEQKQNLALKTQLCEKAEELAGSVFTSRKEWNDASDQIMEIQKVWKTIGFAPKKDNTKIYDRFRNACDRFFEAKRGFYQGIKSEIEDNLQAKLDLCVQAEALKNSEDWKATTDALISLQKKWKEIGATSRKQSEQVWKRFRAACDHFFARKAEHFGSQESQYADNLQQKEGILAEMRALVQQKTELSFEKIKEYQRRWSEIGFVPIKKKEQIQNEYRKIMDALFDMLRGEERQRHMKNFREKVSKITETGGRRLNHERERLYNKVRQLESDIQIWENNIGFFSKSKNADALVKEVQNKIAKAREQIATMIEKINLIDNPEQAKAKEEVQDVAPAESAAVPAAEEQAEAAPAPEPETETPVTPQEEQATQESLESDPRTEAEAVAEEAAPAPELTEKTEEKKQTEEA